MGAHHVGPETVYSCCPSFLLFLVVVFVCSRMYIVVC